MATAKDVQTALKKQGYDPGPIDGIIGRKTIAAIKEFQGDHELVVDGIVGPKTLAVLFPEQTDTDQNTTADNIIPTDQVWFAEAYRLIGTKEEPGAGSNEAILGWGERLRIDYSDDEIPWCGLYVAHCIGSTLPTEPLPTNPLGARNWQKFGTECTTPQPGAIMVFWRGSPDGWQGHVGFYWAEDDTCYHILGGNQSNSVNIVRLSKDRFLSARWPDSALLPNGSARYAAKDGRLLSENEA